jgi:hypothetical protein
MSEFAGNELEVLRVFFLLFIARIIHMLRLLLPFTMKS